MDLSNDAIIVSTDHLTSRGLEIDESYLSDEYWLVQNNDYAAAKFVGSMADVQTWFPGVPIRLPIDPPTKLSR